MMGENPNYWWSLNGKLQPPPSQQAYPTFLSTPMPVPVPVPPPSSILNPPYLFGSSLLVPTTNSNALGDHHHQENLDFPVSWSQLLMTGLTNDQEQQNLGAGHVGDVVVKHGYLDNQQSRQLYYGNKNDHHHHHHHDNTNNNEEDIQACSSSWSSQLNPVPSVGSSSTMSLSTTTMFDFSSKINSQQSHHTNQYSSQYDDTSTSGASKKPRFQSSSTQPSPMCNDTFTSGTSKRSRAHQQSSTQTPLKVRKEKLGDRISALHQLVSPFGKTDTASVLLEATAQIRFLESQIEALTSPYMNLANNVSGGTRHQHSADEKRDLASRGLCLVPVTCMDHIDTTNMTSNGAEFWTPALGGGL